MKIIVNNVSSICSAIMQPHSIVINSKVLFGENLRYELFPVTIERDLIIPDKSNLRSLKTSKMPKFLLSSDGIYYGMGFVLELDGRFPLIDYELPEGYKADFFKSFIGDEYQVLMNNTKKVFIDGIHEKHNLYTFEVKEKKFAVQDIESILFRLSDFFFKLDRTLDTVIQKAKYHRTDNYWYLQEEQMADYLFKYKITDRKDYNDLIFAELEISDDSDGIYI